MDFKVIVSVNQNIDKLSTTDKYNQLFAKAYQALDAYDKKNGTTYLKAEVKGRPDKTFYSIDEYFAHLEYLFNIDASYIMLPLDETPFAINANTRTITNPKITVMQNDQNAEVVMFTIDRYFDYKDLNTAHIYVQWTLPDGKTEGATAIEMKDLSIPGKIRFGWPLDNEITSQKGPVKFSVRFWNVGKVKDENGVEKDAVVYSFNTQTSTLTINESLQPQLNEEYSVNAPIADGFFKKAIINSMLLNENMAIPMDPHFDESGLNLNAYESLTTVTDAEGNTSETLTLTAQAVTGDTGSLAYEWWYKPAEDSNGLADNFYSNTWYPFNATDDKPGFSQYGGTVDNDVYKEATLENGQMIIGEKYYVKSGDDYVAYDGSLPRPTLYERFATYTVPAAPAKVTGQYKVVVTNSIKSNLAESTSQNTTPPRDSKVCQLVSPDEVVFAKNGDLKVFEIFPTGEAGENLGMTLNVKAVDDDSIAAKRVYTWTRKSADKDALSAEETRVVTAADGGHQLAITQPGWYQVKIESTLNRETKSLNSTVCKVAYKTVAPELVSADEEIAASQILTMAYGTESSKKDVDNKGIPQYYGEDGDVFTLDVTTTLNTPAGYDDELFSEGLSYAWGYQVQDSHDFKYLTNEDVGDGKLVVEGLGSPTLKIRVLENDKKYTYKCVITNTVNEQAASCDVATALAFAVQ